MSNYTTNGQGESALDYRIKYCPHPTYDSTEREAIVSDLSAFSDEQIAARFMARHGGCVESVERIPCDCGNVSATWQGDKYGRRSYCCDSCWSLCNE
jgi:hypothetical protein